MKLKGYIFSRPFLKERVPQHIQNIVIRDYCKKKNISYLMSATEYSVEGSSYILSEIIDNLKNYDGIIFYSLFQLPFLKLDRYKIYRIIIKKEKQLHFVVENLVAKNKITFLEIEKIFLLKLQTLNVENSVNKLGELKNYVTLNHKKTSRNYIERMNNNKIECMIVSKKYDYDYWDGDRKFGYGGYKYIKNYHTLIAEKLIKDYQLNNKSKILDIGCAKGFLMYEFKFYLPNSQIYGVDVSKYCKKNALPSIRKNIKVSSCVKLPFKNSFFRRLISFSINNFS
jgi:sporadic carbohydrate cluster protein (TIGR04323 family)